jgi:hypothetical protein
MQDFTAADDPDPQRLAHARVALHEETKTARRIHEPPLEPDALRRDLHGGAIELHVGALRERLEEMRQNAPGDGAASLRPECAFDRQVGLACDESGPGNALLRQGVEGAGEKVDAAGVDDLALDGQPARRALQAVGERARGSVGIGSGKRVSRLARLAQGDGGGSDVLAGVIAAAAAALPFVIVEVKGDAGSDHAPLRRDSQRDVAVVLAHAEHRIGARELDAA